MLYDLENREIQLADVPNRHALIWGQAGYGKTHLCTKMLEEEYENNRQILVIDFSKSYTDSELRKHNFRYLEDVREMDVVKDGIALHIRTTSSTRFKEDLKDTLVSVLGIQSYYQKKILLEAIEKCLVESQKFYVSKLYHVLNDMHESAEKEGKDSNVRNNMLHLITRLEPFSTIKKFCVISDFNTEEVKKSRVTIIQLSSVSEAKRKFLAEIIMLMLWKEIFLLGVSRKFQTLLLDEFQNISIKSGSATYSLLREGRRFGVGVVLATQYITNYSEDEIETLMQAGNSLVFHPADRNISFSAKMIDFENAKAWHVILSRLGRGEVVLNGHFRIMGKDEIIADRIICKVKS